MVDEVFGPYRMLSVLGAGGMGEVWRARDTRKDREVAVKVLGAWLGAEPGYTARFRREAAQAARLNSPNIIPIHDYGEIDGRLFMEMPLINGADLAELLAREGPLDATRAVDIVDQVAAALDTAHAAGLVHRDVKPSNVLVTAHRGRDFAYLIDFGIARAAEDTKVTTTGRQVGTLAYMAPEAFDGGTTNRRSDVYALACVLYEALTAQAPFVAPIGAPPLAFYVNAHLHHPPPAPSKDRSGVTAAMDAVVAQGMAKNPNDRHPSAGALAAAAHIAIDLRPGNHGTAHPEVTEPTLDADSTFRTSGALSGPDPTPDRPSIWPADTSAGGDRPEDDLLIVNDAPQDTATQRRIVTDSVDAFDAAITRAPAVRRPEWNPTHGAANGRRRRHIHRIYLFAAVLVVVGGLIFVLLQNNPSGGAPLSAGTSPENSEVSSASATPPATRVLAVGESATLDTGPIDDILPTQDNHRVWISELNGEISTLRLVDSTTMNTVAQYPLGFRATEMAISPQGDRLYLAGDGLTVFDTAKLTIIATIPVGSHPTNPTVSPDGQVVYVSAGARNNQVQVVTAATNSVRATIDLTDQERDLAVSRDGRALYAQTVSGVDVIDADTDHRTNTIVGGTLPSALRPDGLAGYSATSFVGEVAPVSADGHKTGPVIQTNEPDIPVGISADGAYLYLDYRGEYSSHDKIAELAIATNTVVRTFAVSHYNADATKPSPDGRLLFLSGADPRGSGLVVLRLA